MASDVGALRALLSQGDVIAQVALPSGPCWVTLCKVVRGRGGARAVVRAAGVLVEVPLDALLDARRAGP